MPRALSRKPLQGLDRGHDAEVGNDGRLQILGLVRCFGGTSLCGSSASDAPLSAETALLTKRAFPFFPLHALGRRR